MSIPGSAPDTKTFDTVFDSQRVFRCVLQATARPGEIFVLPPTGAVPAEAVALTLLDHEVSFCVIGGGEDIQERVARLTGSRAVAPSEADLTILSGEPGGISRLKRGTLERPETGATAIFAVDRLSDAGPLNLKLSGPGVPGERALGIEGLSPDAAEEIRSSRADYPLGVDVYLVDGAGRVAGLPRSTRLEVV